MLKSFKDDENNYFAPEGKHYMAVRIPGRDDAKLKQRIKAGEFKGDVVRNQEEQAMNAIRRYAEGDLPLPETLDLIHAYETTLRPGTDLRPAYTRTLQDQPWKLCPCAVCRTIGAEVILHRNLNRHKRRGFHNLFVLHQKVKALRKMNTLSLPCLRIQQSEARYIYSFAVDGKDIQKFASISRIGRTAEGALEGYQRPEILTHIEDIKRYLEQSNSLLPNALIIAFDKKLSFRAIDEPSGATCLGYVDISFEEGSKPGWVVDGQQRLAALRQIVRTRSHCSGDGHRINWH